jgi:hypothetical protein
MDRQSEILLLGGGLLLLLMRRNHHRSLQLAPPLPAANAVPVPRTTAVASEPGAVGRAVGTAAYRALNTHPVQLRGVKRFSMVNEEEEREMFLDMPRGTRMLFNCAKQTVYYVDPSMYDNVTWAPGTVPEWKVYERN